MTRAEDPFLKGNPGSWGRRAWWRSLHLICWIWFLLAYRYRAWGKQNIPAQGPLLVLCNHQSYFDPIIVGLTLRHRPFYALARSSLFNHRGLGWLIHTLNALPIERGQADMAAMRRCLKVLEDGHALLLFPEGTRTPDGTTQPFNPGTMLMIKRSRASVLPIAIEGAYAVWSRHRKKPRCFGKIRVKFGVPIASDELATLSSEAALERLRQQVETMRLELQAMK